MKLASNGPEPRPDDGDPVFTGGIAECHSFIQRKVARAALAAIREPTDEKRELGRR